MTFELIMYMAKKMGEEASEGGGSGGMSVPLLKTSSQFSSIANINGSTVLLSDLYLTPFSS